MANQVDVQVYLWWLQEGELESAVSQQKGRLREAKNGRRSVRRTMSKQVGRSKQN